MPTGGGPVDNNLSWAAGRLWALQPCVQSACTPHVLVSDDQGRSWQPTAAPDIVGLGGAAITAESESNAYVVAPKGDGLAIAVTNDGGRSWAEHPAPCQQQDRSRSPFLESSRSTLMLVCVVGASAGMQVRESWVSVDTGTSWQPAALTTGAGYVDGVATVGDVFVLTLSRGNVMVSSDGGASWSVAFENGEAFPSYAVVPGVGIWIATGRADENAGLWLSADGTTWEQRVRSPHA